MNSKDAMPLEDPFESVYPDGGEVRRRRHENGWPPARLIATIEETHQKSTGLVATISPILLQGIEDNNEAIPYETLCLIADGLDCDPVDILLPEGEENDDD